MDLREADAIRTFRRLFVYKQMLAERIKDAGPDHLEEATNNSDTAVRTAFIVDILSGTSAGGINAIYLAKALANDQKIDQLKDLWVNEGDIALLLNDKRSVMGLHMVNQVPPQSLLNSRRMYYKLLKSLTDMEKYRPSQDHFQSPYVDELDLFITTTDIAGVPVPLRLLDGVVYERRHRNVFHFKYGKAEVLGDDRNDFRAALNPFLAFAARCTSSFPFAFEPMRLCDIDEVVDLFGEYRHDLLCRSDSTEWQRFFQEGRIHKYRSDYSRQNNGILPRNTDFWANMRLLRLLSRVAFICNICFLLASLDQYLPNPPEGQIISTIIVLGYILAILVNVVVNGWILVAWAFRKRPLDIPRWLWIINLIFLVVQLVILFIHT